MNDSIDMRTSTKSEKKVKLAVAQATEHIRNKFKEIHNERKEKYRLWEEQYKPITKKLKNLIDAKTATRTLSSPSTQSQGNHAAAASIDQINAGSSPAAPHAIRQRQRRQPKVRLHHNRLQRRSNLRKAIQSNVASAADAYNARQNMPEPHVDLSKIPSDDDDDDLNEIKRPLELSDSEDALQRRRSKAVKVDRTILTKKLTAPYPKALQLNSIRQIRKQVKPRRSEIELLQLPYYDPVALHQRKFAVPGKRLTRSISLSGLNAPAKPVGQGMIDLTKKEFHSNNDSKNFIYWNDVNELVSRLRLLVSSASAGHTGHNNEILSIIEELREENIIA